MQLTCFIVFALAFVANGVHSQQCHMREIDLCVATGMFQYQSNGIPGDESKVDEWCDTIKEVQECMTNFSTKCLSPVQQEVVTLLSGGEDVAMQMCTKGTEIRSQYLKHAECLSEAAESDEFKKNLRNLLATIEHVFEAPFQSRFPMMCCGLNRFRVDIERDTDKLCGKEAVVMTTTIWRMVTSGLPDTMCDRFEPEENYCKDLLPPRGTPTKGADSKSQIAKLLDTVFGGL